MDLVCLDMESTLTPEMWIEFAKRSGNDALLKTSRDEPDYDKLMNFRITYLRDNGIKLETLLDVFKDLEPLEGAREFLDELRSIAQVIIISDTFPQFASSLVEKLGRPTLFANELQVDDDGFICGYKMRCTNSKYDTVRGLQSIGFETIAAGDSYNDIEMIQASRAGFLFNANEQIKNEFPEIPAFTDYDKLLDAIKKTLK